MSGTHGPVHIICGAWPPMPGGVADHSWIAATGLADAGYEVHVWTAERGSAQPGARVRVHPCLRRWSPAELLAVGRELDALGGPRRIVVQWVPHDFGYKSLNLALPAWLLWRTWRGDVVVPLVHEGGLPFRLDRPQIFVAAIVHRLMAAVLLQAAAGRVLVTVPFWRRELERWAFGRRLAWEWLPVTSTIEPRVDAAATDAVRARHGLAGKLVVGSFGVHGGWTTTPLAAVLARVLRGEDRRALVIGPHGEHVQQAVAAIDAAAATRVIATGALPASDVSAHLAACDVLVQPYHDGVSARRTAAMAALSHERPLVTMRGAATEELWFAERAAEMADGDGPPLAAAVEALLANPTARAALARRGRECYARHFQPRRIVEGLATALGPP